MDWIDKRLNWIDSRFDRMDVRLDKNENRLEKVEHKTVEIYKERKELKYSLDHYVLFKSIWLSWLLSIIISVSGLLLFK